MASVSIQTIAEVLTATGSYGLIAVLGWAFWKATTKKDRELKSLYNKLIDLSERQIEATLKVGVALESLRTAIERLK